MMKFVLWVAGVCAATPLLCQVDFWSEDFGSGCDSEQLVSEYGGPNGAWTVANTGVNESTANAWFVSAEENGNAVGQCGSACGNNRTLHVGANGTLLGTDLGASYFEGLAGFCQFFGCGATDKRVESPVINCGPYTSIFLTFKYIEGGNSIDNATLWYFDGTSWTQLADMTKTFSTVCDPQGVWTPFTIALPASAFNNSSVKIGFRWINNDDGDAIDPSFAVDDIVFSGTPAGGDTTPPVVECNNQSLEAGPDCTALLPDVTSLFNVYDDTDPNPSVIQDPAAGTLLSVGIHTVTVTVTDASGNSATCEFDAVVQNSGPLMTCPAPVSVNAEDENGAWVTVPVPDILTACGVVEYSNNFTSVEDASAQYPVGVTTVLWTGEDVLGYSYSCSTQITVIGTGCCDGDFNCDGIVGIQDLLILLNDFSCMGACLPDLSNDGVVGAEDQVIFLTLFGTVCP